MDEERINGIPVTQIGNVPCNGCTACCRNDIIRIFPHEDISQWHTVPHEVLPGWLQLKRRSNGDCIYLTNTGCSIHPNTPMMCREMDCRLVFKNVTYTRARKMEKTNPGFFATWNQGKKMFQKLRRENV